MLVNMHDIREMTIDYSTFYIGCTYQQNGFVTLDKHIALVPNNQMVLTAEVMGNHPMIWFDRNSGAIRRFECDCGQRDTRHLCKHCVALCAELAMLPDDAINKEGKIPLRSDPSVNTLINNYIDTETREIESATKIEHKNVHLIPTIVCNEQFDGVYFTIGDTKQYVLKDIFEFCYHMERRDYADYGKGFGMTHTLESFDEKSQAYAQMIIDRSKRQRRDGLSVTEKRYVWLQQHFVDRFFALAKDDPINGDIYHTKATYTVTEDPAPLRFSVERKDDGYLLSVPNYVYLKGIRDGYLLFQDNNKIYHLSTEIHQDCGPLLQALPETGFRLNIGNKDIRPFCNKVLSKVIQHIPMVDATNDLQQYIRQKMEATLYLDAPNETEVTCKPIARYGDHKYSLFSSSDKSMRDPVAENRLTQALLQYFPDSADKKGVLHVTDDDAIYRLLDEGVNQLSALATIEVSDRMDGINIRQKPHVSVGVSLNSGIMDVIFSADGLSGSEMTEILHSYREKRRYHRLRDGSFLRMDSSMQALSELAEIGDLSDKALKNGHAQLPMFRAAALDSLLKDKESVRFERDSKFRSLLLALNHPEDSEIDPPASLAKILRPYQENGVRWLTTLSKYGFGGILADDMGLGKTLQVLCVLLLAQESGETLPSIVVCPASLVLNWKAEAEKFTPQIPVRVIMGIATQRKDDIANIQKGELVITSYDLLRRDSELYQKKQFLYEIVDEAQYIKNHTTVNAKVVKAIRAKHKFALTGTPVENRLSEIWSIFDYVMSGYLFNYTKFRSRIETPVVKENDDAAKQTLSRMVAPFVLRRLKKDVLTELPPKTETVMKAVMEGKQRDLYLAKAQEAKLQLQGELQKGDTPQSRVKILAILTRLRQICCDPSLCFEDYDGENTKMDMCLELLRQAIDGGHKTLLFSQFTQMLDRIAKKLDENHISYYMLTGDTSKADRQQLVDDFNKDDTEVFLISLKAGGTGLNLTGADTVIHYDPWWNVAAENQASDRAHRIGQSKNVQVYRLIAGDSIEEKILKLHDMKKELSDAVLAGAGDGDSFHLTDEDIEMLLNDN